MTGSLPLEIIKDNYPPVLPIHPDDAESPPPDPEGVCDAKEE